MSIRDNIDILKSKISKAAQGCGVNPKGIIIVCVSKTRSVKDICQVLDAGINYIAESKVQEAQEKYPAIAQYAKDKNIDLNFHMVGHLQTNKASKAVDMFSLIHSLDSLKLAEKISEYSKASRRPIEVLVEVNTSGEESKYGVEDGKVTDFLKEIAKFDNIRVRGLMTMAPLVKQKEDARPYFRKLRQLRDEIREKIISDKVRMDFLSMGMSQDYEVAIQEGSNMLRIGAAIFEGLQ